MLSAPMMAAHADAARTIGPPTVVTLHFEDFAVLVGTVLACIRGWHCRATPAADYLSVGNAANYSQLYV